MVVEPEGGEHVPSVGHDIGGQPEFLQLEQGDLLVDRIVFGDEERDLRAAGGRDGGRQRLRPVGRPRTHRRGGGDGGMGAVAAHMAHHAGQALEQLRMLDRFRQAG